jgi:DNA-binding transcriptional ArsR family regulator
MQSLVYRDARMSRQDARHRGSHMATGFKREARIGFASWFEQGDGTRLHACAIVLTSILIWRILYHMGNYYSNLDRTFAALVDPTRRAILARLEREESASISALAKPFAIKLPAVMKHLAVLDDAGLVVRTKAGREVTVRLNPAPMREAMDWLRRYERFWPTSTDRLASYAEEKEAEARKTIDD